MWIEPRRHAREMSEQMMEDNVVQTKFHAKSVVNNKDKYKIDYFPTGLEIIADMKASAKLTNSIHHEFKVVLQTLAASKEYFHYGSEGKPSHTMYHWN